jgi:hypothetical protein
MFTMAVLVEIRADGKLYPPKRRTAAEVARLRDLEHLLRCYRGLSMRAVQAAMAKEGIRRSIGMIHRDLQQYECPRCGPPPPLVPTDPRMRARPVPWR